MPYCPVYFRVHRFFTSETALPKSRATSLFYLVAQGVPVHIHHHRHRQQQKTETEAAAARTGTTENHKNDTRAANTNGIATLTRWKTPTARPRRDPRRRNQPGSAPKGAASVLARSEKPPPFPPAFVRLHRYRRRTTGSAAAGLPACHMVVLAFVSSPLLLLVLLLLFACV